MLKQHKAIIYHGKEFLVPERFFIDYKESIVFTAGHCEVFVKSQPKFEYEEGETYAIGLLPILSTDAHINLQKMTRRLNALPVKEQDDDDFSYFVTREFGKAPVEEDAFAKFETSYIRADDKAEPAFIDSEVILLPVSDDYIIELDLALLAKFNYLTVDNTKDQAVRLHKGLPAFDGARWDSFTEQLKLENLDGNFKGDSTKSYSFESLIRKAKKKVIVQKRDCGMFYMGRHVKDLLTVTQRYSVGAVNKEDRVTAKDVFDAFERIKAKEGLIYTIIKSVIDVFRRDEKLLATEVEDEGNGYRVITWNLNTDNSGDVEIRYENFEDYVSDESWVELTFWLNALCVSFKILEDDSKVEGAIGNTETFVPMLAFDSNQLHQDYKDFALFVAKALHKIAGLND